MEKGSIIYINYVGKEKASGKVFDTNIEDVAKKSEIYEKTRKYKPLPVIIGAGFLLKGVEEELKKMKVGEKKMIELAPEKAFGVPDPNLRRYFSLKEFLDKNIKPKVGDVLSFGNFRGRVVSIDGGRVLVDFNHPLAGKTVIFEIEIIKEVKAKEERIAAILDIFTGRVEDFEISIVDSSLEIKDKKNLIDGNLMRLIKENIFKWIDGISEIRFVYTFRKEK